MSRRPLFPPVFAANVSRPLVDDFTLRAARQRARQQPSLPIFHEIPLRSHPLWSGNNSLGIEVALEDLIVSSTAVFERTILKLDEWGPPAVWTISLSTNVPDLPNTNDQAYALVGLLEFGAGGIVDQLTVDWRNGTTLRLPMNALNVKVRGRVGSAVDTPAIIPPDFAVRVILSKSDQSGLPPQITQFLNATNGAVDPSNVAAIIPRYAKAFRPLGTNQVSADALFAANTYWEFYATSGIGGALLAALRAQDAANYLSSVGGIPIPTGARYVVFNNNAALGARSFNLVFDLSL